MAANKNSNLLQSKRSGVVFNIRVYILGDNREIIKERDIEINAKDEKEAFEALPEQVKQIHSGEWLYAGYFKVKK
ncbi:MAG: hypothetical protein QXF70_03495 [Candidatus Bilamarchaeaceae archaeon]